MPIEAIDSAHDPAFENFENELIRDCCGQGLLANTDLVMFALWAMHRLAVDKPKIAVNRRVINELLGYRHCPMVDKLGFPSATE